ncbi:MAG TPA: spirocyclase AveC family protein [Acidimicrobiales bacterium]
MTVNKVRTAGRLDAPRPTTTDRRVRLVHWFAIVGVPILLWETWTVIAWLADGPHQITQFRHGHTVDWYGARAFEGVAIVIAIAVLIEVVRGCIRAGKILTFDVMFCLCGATLFWADVGSVNFFQPVVVMSSNWVNLNNTCGHMPFVVNPDCGRAPDPILFLWLIGTFGALGGAMLLGALARWAQGRWPRLTMGKVLGVVFLASMAMAAAEPLLVGLHLWSYPGAPFALPLGSGMAYPAFPELIAFTLWFGILAAVRIFRDDRGQTLVERGLERHSAGVRKAVTLLALYAVMQLVTWGPAGVPDIALGLYARSWPKMPVQVVNNECDAPGIHGTRYGPCPGSPGYRMPGRHSRLPGQSP